MRGTNVVGRARIGRLALACSALLAALAILAGCGGSGDQTVPVDEAEDMARTDEAAESDEENGEEREGEKGTSVSADPRGVREALRAVLASSDPQQACAAFVTERYVSESYGSGQACRLSQRPAAAARRLRIGPIDLPSEKVAETTVLPEGGVYDGIELDVRLAFRAGSWRVDDVDADLPPGP